MPYPLEQRDPNEAALIAEMIAILRRQMLRDYARGDMRRGAHPKTLGLLRARFEVEPDLPAELRVGIFKTPQTYDCWVRCSNSSSTIQSDAVADARGIAIKLMAPGGNGRVTDEPLGQDFVLLSAPVMPLGTVALFRDAVHYAVDSSLLLFGAKLLLTGNAGVLLGLAGLRSNPSSPLDMRYWSTTPYRFGKREAVKYSLRPTSTHRSRRPSKPGESYLSEAMQSHLSKHVASFEFGVQFQRDGMPIEDAGQLWDERVSPFLKVATLHIPRQAFRTAKRDAIAEALVFSPGHALPEHAPLGGLNRARIKIYRALSRLRNSRNQSVRQAADAALKSQRKSSPRSSSTDEHV